MFSFNKIDYILKGLNRLIKSLNAAAEAHDKKVVAHEQQISKLEAKKQYSATEAARARHIASNFQGLLGPTPVPEPNENPDNGSA